MRCSHQGILESRMLGNLARPVWGWGPGETPGPTPLFVGSPKAGHRAAILTSLLASCKNNYIEPWAYLRDVFTRLAYQLCDQELTLLLPDNWLADHSEHRWNIAKQRKEE